MSKIITSEPEFKFVAGPTNKSQFQNILNHRRTTNRRMESNSVRDMEHYQYLMGSLEMLNYIAQALSDLLEKQELMDD